MFGEKFDEWNEQSNFSAPTTSKEQALCQAGVPRCPAGRQELDQQIARISGLLGQLDDPIHSITGLLLAPRQGSCWVSSAGHAR